MSQPHVLCRYDDIAENACRSFVLGSGRERLDIFIVRQEGEVHGYVNSCPHAGTPLDWLPDRFLTPDNRFLMCTTHGALFEVKDGMCVRGPCRGIPLEKLPILVENGDVVLLPPPPEDAA
ncbi:MAG: Rieske (2Fe-2S) protein [Alphaproteobacteria bacterium]